MREGDDQWFIPCRDGAGRPRNLIVFVTDSADIALHAPPGEVAVISSNHAGEVKDAITAAQIRAVARRQSW
jgi:hypothetical protein